MEDTTKVLDLLDELEETLENATTVPLTNKIVIETETLYEIIKDIRLSLPDDIQQAKWIRDERDRILEEAKSEYERIILEAQKQADYLVETDEITRRANQLATQKMEENTQYCKQLKMLTFDYVDKMLYDMQGKMDELNMKYFGEMYSNLEQTFGDISSILNSNREEMRQLAIKTQTEGE